MSTYIDDTLVLNTLIQIAGENPDYQYAAPERISARQCVYSDGKGNASCIVGHVIARLEPELFKLIEKREWHPTTEERTEAGDYEEGTNPISYPVSDLSTMVGFARVPFSPLMRDVLQTAQGLQDDGKPWGFAAFKAIARFNSRVSEEEYANA